jgi:hypothetical protein
LPDKLAYKLRHVIGDASSPQERKGIDGQVRHELSFFK